MILIRHKVQILMEIGIVLFPLAAERRHLLEFLQALILIRICGSYYLLEIILIPHA